MMGTRVYYRVVFETCSAMSIGTLDSDLTDNDIALDGRGMPYIPGTSLAGVCRSFFYDASAIQLDDEGEIIEDHREDKCRRIFGALGSEGESAVRVYDATLLGRPQANTDMTVRYNQSVAIRDGVKLRSDEKTAEKHKKFDREVVEAGAVFETFIEVLDENRCTKADLEDMLYALHTGALTIGSKTTRGMGRVKIVTCWRRAFELTDEAQRKAWLGFDMFNSTNAAWRYWDSETNVGRSILSRAESSLSCKPDEIALRLCLSLRGGIAVREYTGESGEESINYRQLAVEGTQTATNPDGSPVIPGTSWAGAIRSRYRQISPDQEAMLFGNVDEETNATQRSLISFGESELMGGEWKTVTRNAIDPFTGGVTDGACYTERTYWGGSTWLDIRVHGVGGALGTKSVGVQELKPLIAAIADLHNGFLAVGGLTSVGRGLFRIDKQRLIKKSGQTDPEIEKSMVYARGVDVTDSFFKLFDVGTRQQPSSLVVPNLDEVAELLYGATDGRED